MVFSIHNLESKFVCSKLFVEKKDIVRHIADCKLCVVQRKCCTKATKKVHFSQLLIAYFLVLQNKTNKKVTTRLPLPLIYRAAAFVFLTDRKKIAHYRH